MHRAWTFADVETHPLPVMTVVADFAQLHERMLTAVWSGVAGLNAGQCCAAASQQRDPK